MVPGQLDSGQDHQKDSDNIIGHFLLITLEWNITHDRKQKQRNINPMKIITTNIAVILSIILSSGCSSPSVQDTVIMDSTGLKAVHVKTIDGFKVPECTLYSPDSGLVYVSNVDSKPGEYWTDDGKGHISVIGSNLLIMKNPLTQSTHAMALHAPKGMCILGKYLYFTDNTRLMRCDTATGLEVNIVSSGFVKANDLATDGNNVWVSDGDAGKVYCVAPNGKRREIQGPEGVNGITFYGRRLFAVSWTLHDLYELDPNGIKPPIAFGIGKSFTNLDGIEVLGDGTFIVSDFMGNKVSTVGPDRSTVKTLITVNSPADIGLDRQNGLIYVPQFMEDKVSIYKLEQ